MRIMKVDMKKYLAAHDLVYKSAPKIWQEGLLAGNGDVGALFFAPFFPEFLVNKIDIWDYKTVRGKLIKYSGILKKLKEGKELNEIIAEENKQAPASSKISAPKTGGKLRLRFGKDDNWAGAYKIMNRLSIYDGVLHTSMDRHLAHPRLRSFVHSGKNVFCLSANEVSAIVDSSVKIELFRPPDAAYKPPVFGTEKDVVYMKTTLSDGFHYIIAVKAVALGTAAYVGYTKKYYRPRYWAKLSDKVTTLIEPDRAALAVRGEFELFASVVTSKESKTPLKDAISLVDAAARAGFRKLYQEHVKWWDAFWKKSFIAISDKIIEQLWYTSLYMQASQYRKAPVPALQGLAFGPSIDGTQALQWCGTYTNDQNSEMVPMPFFALNHPELARPFFDTFNRMIPQVKRDTREIFGMRGMNFPMGCGIDGKITMDHQYSFIQCGGPFHGIIYCWAWRYTKDKKLLREKLYPFIKEVCNFFADYMTYNEKTGKYRLYPSQPPEVPFLDVGNPTHTLSLLKVNLQTAIEASEILSVDKNDRGKWIHLLGHYPEYPMDEGIFVEGDTVPARHYISQSGGLYPVYPCGEYDENSPKKIIDACLKTYWSVYIRQSLASFAQAKGRHFLNGWEHFFHIMQAMRLGLNQEVTQLLYQEYLRLFMKPNGLFSHNAIVLADSKKSEKNLNSIPDIKILDGKEWMPLREPMSNQAAECTENLEAKEQVFSVIETSSIFLAIINEMLMQSHNGILRLFPAAPKRWNAAFDNFRAEGAFLVSSSMARGMVKYVSIKSLAGGSLKIKNPWKNKTIFINGRKPMRGKYGEYIPLNFRRNEMISCFLDKGEFYKARNQRPENTNTIEPKRLRFYDGSRAWLGKPDLSEYYKW